MKNKTIQSQIDRLRDELEKLESLIEAYAFNDEDENKEEALDEVNGAIICLDGLEDVFDRDAELEIMREVKE